MGGRCGFRHRRIHTPDIPEPGEGAEMLRPTHVALQEAFLACGSVAGAVLGGKKT